MRFDDIRHQERAIRLIRSLLVRRTPHAWLLVGPQGVGKERTARVLAGRLMCTGIAPKGGGRLDESAAQAQTEPHADPCGQCPSCRLLTGDSHPDLHVVHRGLHRWHPDTAVRRRKGLLLSVEVIRHFVIDPASRTPAVGRRRVFIIRDAEQMNDPAANALLKTLEEPPGQAVLILLTSQVDRLLPTIRSRCQIVRFDPLPRGFIEQKLLEHGAAPQAARALAGLCAGGLGPALRWLEADLLGELEGLRTALGAVRAGDPEGFGRVMVDAATSLASRLVGAGSPEAVETDEAATDEPVRQDAGEAEGEEMPRAGGKAPQTDELRAALRLLLMLLAAVYRESLIEQVCAAVGPGAEALRGARLLRWPDVDLLARRGTAEELAQAVAAVAQAEEMIDRNVSPQLACEHLAAVLCGSMVVS